MPSVSSIDATFEESQLDDVTLTIDRREVLRRVTALLGGSAVVGASGFLAGCATEPAPRSRPVSRLFSGRDIALLDEVAETILPETGTPGAKAAGVGPFIAVMVTDAYSPDEQRIFLAGLDQLEVESLAMHNRGFLDATPAERLALVERLDREQHEYMQRQRAGGPAHYFRMLKELTVLGYFTSEIGYTQAMRYEESPGRWDPCVPYRPGDTIWAPHA